MEVITYYDDLIDWVSRGNGFNINLKQKSIIVYDQNINMGMYSNDAKLIEIPDIENSESPTQMCLDIIENLYHNYKYSTPSKYSEKNKQKYYFKALSPDEMTDEQLFKGENREIARAKLEGFILLSSLAGYLIWNEREMGKWFYQGKDKDLIILREWIEDRTK